VNPPTPIIPVSRSLFLCEAHIGYADARLDLYGIFNVLRPGVYPYTLPNLVVFSQLTNGLGDVPFFFDIRRASAAQSLFTTHVNTVRFPDRTAMRQVVTTIDHIRFPSPGVYVVDLFCHNTWVCDTTLVLE
jgi:hypothetical protein